MRDQGHDVLLLLVLDPQHLGIMDGAFGDLILGVETAQVAQLEQVTAIVLLEEQDQAEPGDGQQGQHLHGVSAFERDGRGEEQHTQQDQRREPHHQVGEPVQVAGVTVGVADRIGEDADGRKHHGQAVAAGGVGKGYAGDPCDSIVGAATVGGGHDHDGDVDPEADG